MKHGKREMPRKHNSKALTALVAVALILCCTVGGTLAWLATSTDPVENTFIPAKVSTEVDEDTENGVKSNVTILNKSDIAVYVRAAIVVNWVKLDDNGKVVSVYAEQPVKDRDYYCTIGNGWQFNTTDGYYYHAAKVPAGESTGKLIVEADLMNDTAVIPKDYQLQISILSEAIQADGMGVNNAQDAWAKAIADANAKS